MLNFFMIALSGRLGQEYFIPELNVVLIGIFSVSYSQVQVLTLCDEEKMLAKENSGFSLDGSVHLESWDRCRLERLLRHCCRPLFASENLRWNGKKVIYNLSKPNHKGQTSIQLEPVEFIERIATLK